MKKLFGTLILVGAVTLALAAPASAFEICFGLDNFGSKFKLEVTQFGNFFQLSGSERAFADRAVSGTAFIGSNNTVRLGFLQVANAGPTFSDIIWNASLDLSTLSGPYTGRRVAFNDDISGNMMAIPCAGVADSQNLPDAAAR